MTDGQVLGFLAAPDRQMCLHAISKVLLKVRSLDGMTCDKLGKTLECSADSIRHASNEESMLSFDCIARLCYFFPEQCAPVFELWGRAAPALTVADRVDRIERELAAIRREAA